MSTKLVPFLAHIESISHLEKLHSQLMRLTRLHKDFQEVALLNHKSLVEEEDKVLLMMVSKVVFISLKMLMVQDISLQACSERD